MAKDRLGDTEERLKDKVACMKLQQDWFPLDKEIFELERMERNQHMEDDWARNIIQDEIQKYLLNVINKVMTKID